MNRTEFYAACDALLGQRHEPPKTYRKRGRWGPREPGSGRYEGFGLIRYFSSNLVQVSLSSPVRINQTTTAQGALALIATIAQPA